MSKRKSKVVRFGAGSGVVMAHFRLDTKAMRGLGKRAASGNQWSVSLWRKVVGETGWKESERAPKGWCMDVNLDLDPGEFAKLAAERNAVVWAPGPRDPDYPL